MRWGSRSTVTENVWVMRRLRRTWPQSPGLGVWVQGDEFS